MVMASPSILKLYGVQYTTMSSRSPGQRAGLTHVAVLTAASELLVEEGLAALTMRAVAARLGVAPNALYSHVPNKTALLDDVLDHALAQVTPPAPDGDPGEGLHELLVATRAVLLDRPDLAPHYLARQGARGPNAQLLGDIMLALLARAGVTGDDAREALRVLIVYTIGFAALGSGGPLTVDETGRSFDRGLRWLLAGITATPPRMPTPTAR
jgi:AcrR family transcriptional regulator